MWNKDNNKELVRSVSLLQALLVLWGYLIAFGILLWLILIELTMIFFPYQGGV